MRTKINLHNIPLLQHHLVTRIRGVVCRTVVDTQTTRESHTTLNVITLFQTRVTSQSTNRVLNTFRDLCESLTGLNVLLGILAHLTVHLRTLTVLLQEIIVHAVQVSLLLAGRTVRVVVFVFADLALGELAVGEEGRQGDARRGALDLGATLLLLLGLALLLLCGCIRVWVSVHIGGEKKRERCRNSRDVTQTHLRLFLLPEQRFLPPCHRPNRPRPRRVRLG